MPIIDAHFEKYSIAVVNSTLLSHYKRLSDESKKYRFMAKTSNDTLSKIVETRTKGTLISLLDKGVLRGVCEVYKTSTTTAEIGISIEDAYQGQGFGKKLIEAGIQESRNMNIKEIDFYFDTRNKNILHLLRSLKAEINIQGIDATAKIFL